MNRLLFFFILCSLFQNVVYGLSFNECSTEEEAIAWIRSKIEANEKIDKNIISIVAPLLSLSFSGYPTFMVECC